MATFNPNYIVKTPTFNMIQNYIYLYHTNTYVIVPSYPESITDSMSSTFAQESPIARSAPIFVYSSSGPRSVQIDLPLHRDMMTQINYGVSNLNVELGDDYVDTLIKQLQSISVPQYVTERKMINPPMVAVRFGNDIFIKGVVNGNINVTYESPILEGNHYAQVSIGFTVSEVDPYSAEMISEQGSFRGFSTTLERNLYNK